MRIFCRFSGLLCLLLAATSGYARHVKGGHIEYTYNGVGSSAGTSSYSIEVTVFFSCTTSGPKDNVYLGIFDAVNGNSAFSKLISVNTINTVSKGSSNPCMSNPPTICYEIRTYVYTLDLPENPNGYIITVQDAFRIDGIVNIIGSASSGITLTANIPGSISGTDYHINNSPHFIFKDTAIVCYLGNFSYQFAATDVDGDSLSYAFGNGLNVASANSNTSTTAPGAPPYPSLSYNTGYSGSAPLGPNVSINPVTGLISGVAPSTPGEYVVAVYVKEWRKGVLIAQLKKELQIYVFNCSLVGAALNDSYVNCKDYTYTFQNESTNSSITSYSWDFGVKSLTNDTSSQPVPTYTYPDTGVYILKLKVGTANGCLDSTTAPVKVFPGFTPDFSFSGSCYQSPIQFTNTSIVKYGTPAFSWDFGEPASLTNISTLSNPTHQYAAPGNETVTLLLTSSKGCVDTIAKQVVVTGKPDIALPFRDTLICSIDSLPLIVNSVNAGSYQWTPAYNIINASSAHPIVYPKDTTVYTVVVQDKGCIDSASITVNVLDYITVSLPADTTICATDSITLRPATYGLSFQWSPAASLSSSTVKYPLAAPASTTTYTVLANLGKCQASASQKIRVVPYPGANAGPDTTICFGASAVLHGSLTANSFTWSPLLNVSNSTTLQPTVSPLLTTNYVLTVMDTLGCPKPVSDTVLVTVLPKIGIDAGRDTSIVVGQPLQLQAIAAASNLQYSWSPSTWLNNSSIANPVAQINNNTVDSIYYTVTVKNPASCAASDGIHVLVYKTLPDIFVPSAFTPNGDGRNDFMHPILIGIRQLNYFRIYNRWGQLIFSSAQNNSSWDGRLSGQLQDPGSYVYVVSAVDYLGKQILKKGSFVLLR